MSNTTMPPPGGNPAEAMEQATASSTPPAVVENEAAEPRRIVVTIFENRHAKVGKAQGGTFDKLVERFSHAKITTKPKDDLPGWCPVTFSEHQRAGEKVQKIHLVVVEYDNKEVVVVTDANGNRVRKLVDIPAERRTSVEAALAVWDGYSAFSYTSSSHTPEHHKFRLLLETSRDIEPDEYPRIWRWVKARAAEAGHVLDDAAKDASRLWYVPVRREGREFVTIRQEGRPLDVDAILKEVPAEPPKKREWKKDTRLAAYIEQVSSLVSMPELLQADGIELHRRGSLQAAFSPFRDDGQKPSFVVYEDHAFDFVTSEHYSPLRYIREKQGKNFWEALDLLADLAGIPSGDRLARRDADKPIVVDPTPLFAALPDTLPAAGASKILRPVTDAIATLDVVDQKPWVDRLRGKYKSSLTRDAILAMVKEGERRGEDEGDDEVPAAEATFDVVDGQLCQVIQGRRGTEHKPIANFDARIVEAVTEDDGAERKTTFRVEWSTNGTPLAPVDVPANEFEKLDWVVPLSRGRAYINKGSGNRDAARHAILSRSEPKDTMRYAHTGWRQIDDNWVFLHAGGAIGKAEASVNINHDKLSRYRFPAHQESKTVIGEAIDWMLALLRVTPPTVGYPLLCSMLSAPLASVLPVNFTMALIGRSGTLKTSLALEHQRAFGEMRSDQDLPLNFASSPAAVELVLHACKDVLVVMDDFYPRKDAKSADKQRDLADGTIRSVGNRQARERSTRALRLQANRPPRCVLWMTCEEDPAPAESGESAANRVLKIPFDEKTVDSDLLKEVQLKGQPAVAMRAYLEQLAVVWYRRFDRDMPERHAKVRDQFRAERGLQKRQPDILATLLVSLDVFFHYFACQLPGAGITGREAEEHVRHARAALLEVARNQTVVSSENHPVARWVDALKTLLRSGRIRVVDRKEPLGTSGTTKDVGWYDDVYVFVDPDLADAEVKKFLTEKREYVALSMSSIFQELVVRGWASPPNEKGRIGTRTSNLGGGRPRVLVMPRALFNDVALTTEEPSADERARQEAKADDCARRLDHDLGTTVEPPLDRWLVADLAVRGEQIALSLRENGCTFDVPVSPDLEVRLGECGVADGKGVVSAFFRRHPDGIRVSIEPYLKLVS